ncbi:MAG: hypothetical protein RIT26_2320 [Pseudomonadota bacterium]|jgi:serine/threonine-protein kinase HipA
MNLLLGRVAQEALALHDETVSENAETLQARPELSATMAGEARCLRAILHTVVGEMVRRLGI